MVDIPSMAVVLSFTHHNTELNVPWHTQKTKKKAEASWQAGIDEEIAWVHSKKQNKKLETAVRCLTANLNSEINGAKLENISLM